MEIGLSEGESQIYLALLQQGACLVSKLAQITGAHRTHIYDTLEKLREKGFVSYVIKENRKYFQAVNPQKILDFLREKQEKLEQDLPQMLNLIQESGEEVKVELYKGLQGIKVVIRDLLQNSKEFHLFGKSRFEEMLPKYFIEKIVNEMNTKKIKEFMILEEGQKIMRTKYGHYKYIDKKYLFPTAALVYQDKVALFIWKKPYYIILIEDKDTAESYKKHFQLLWQIARLQN